MPEEYRVQYVFDRTDTTATVWMGLTAGCARCHDHKFDPLSQREYYQLAAFFNTVAEVGLDGSEGNAEPKLPAPDRGQRAVMEEFEAELLPLDTLLNDPIEEAVAAQAAWQSEWGRRLAATWRPLEPLELESRAGAEMILLDDGSVLVSGENPAKDVYVIEAETGTGGIAAVRLEALRDPSDPSAGIGRSPDGSFVLTEIEVEATPVAGGGPSQDLNFVHAHSDHATSSMPVELAIDGDGETGWGAGYAGKSTARTAVFLVGQGLGANPEEVAVSHPGGTRLRIVLRQESNYPQKSIRRFRLSVSSAPEARNRLGLARWLVDGDHPLTARVTANRMWQRFFGRGLVGTSGDFGSQGEWPSHPELLDWLATELVRLDWDLKALQKTIVLSSTYRQSSRASPELIERDPENRLLARASRFRLDAEVIRDTALAAAGLLVERLGGPSVKPYQPAGLWREIGYESRGRFTAGIFEQDTGEALYRRSLYTFWKRTVPPPNMLVFDAPNRETCIVERSRSNTPLQALVLMNDPQFVEAARVLAENLLAAHGEGRSGRTGDAEVVGALYRRVLARAPTQVESEV